MILIRSDLSKKKVNDEEEEEEISSLERRDLYGTGEVNEHDVSSTGEVNVIRQHKYRITSTSI